MVEPQSARERYRLRTVQGHATAPANVCFGPADIAASFDRFVGNQQKVASNRQAGDLAVFKLITSSNFAGCCTGNSAGFAPAPSLQGFPLG
jgi:hypothetical protein